jgi:hypothetical protein
MVSVKEVKLSVFVIKHQVMTYGEGSPDLSIKAQLDGAWLGSFTS